MPRLAHGSRVVGELLSLILEGDDPLPNLKASTANLTNLTKANLTEAKNASREALNEAERVATNASVQSFLFACMTHLAIAGAVICVFEVIRGRHPMVYSLNAMGHRDALKFVPARFGWVKAGTVLTKKQITHSVGLDAAMMLDFLIMFRNMALVMGVVFCAILCPLNFYFGTGAAGNNQIGHINLLNTEAGGWIDWLHAVAVWGVTVGVQVPIHWKCKDFLRYRFGWLEREVPKLRANTILVTGIPPELQSDSRLAAFFNSIFSGADAVMKAYVTRNTSELQPLWAKLRDARAGLKQAEATWKMNEKAGKERPTIGLTCCGYSDKVDSIEHYQSQIKELEPQVEEARKKVNKDIKKGEPGMYFPTGFVTFNHHIYREVSLNLKNLYKDRDLLVRTDPPEPTDIVWRNLARSAHSHLATTLLGYALLAALLFTYTPTVIAITNVAEMVNMGPLQNLWKGVAPTVGLTIMTSMLPSFLMIIITTTSGLKSETEVQHSMQKIYFWFLVFLVLGATAFAQDMYGLTKRVLVNPWHLFVVMAERMPNATNFYMNLLVVDWSSDAMQLLRVPVFMKFNFFKKIYDEKAAKDASEPEDQDYYGIGARSARMSITIAIGIVFGTLSPPIWLLCALSLAMKRVVFGYLLVFAENRKPDLGGVFWVYQLHGIFIAVVIYTTLMTAVFYFRSGGWSGPAALTAPSVPYIMWVMRRFERGFLWERPPFNEIVQDLEASPREKQEMIGMYAQPELVSESD